MKRADNPNASFVLITAARYEMRNQIHANAVANTIVQRCAQAADEPDGISTMVESALEGTESWSPGDKGFAKAIAQQCVEIANQAPTGTAGGVGQCIRQQFDFLAEWIAQSAKVQMPWEFENPRAFDVQVVGDNTQDPHLKLKASHRFYEVLMQEFGDNNGVVAALDTFDDEDMTQPLAQRWVKATAKAKREGLKVLGTPEGVDFKVFWYYTF